MAKVFISYAKADYIGSDGNIIPESPVAKIVEAFKDAGVPFWMDREGLGPGETFAERISRSILDCEVLLFISSATANASEWTLREISTAISNGKRIIPVRIDGSPYDQAVSFYLSSLQYIDWYDLGEKEALRRIVGNILHPGFDSTSGIEVGKLPRLTSIILYAALVVLTALYAVLTYLFLWAKTLQSSEVIGGLIGLTQEFTLLLSIYYVIRLLRRRHSTFILPLSATEILLCADEPRAGDDEGQRSREPADYLLDNQNHSGRGGPLLRKFYESGGIPADTPALKLYPESSAFHLFVAILVEPVRGGHAPGCVFATLFIRFQQSKMKHFGREIAAVEVRSKDGFI